MASRLRWPRESSTESSQSFRLYSPATYKFASVRPYSAALYGGRSSTLGLSLVFANKGDCFASAGVGEEHIPILWGLHSTDRFNQIANTRTKDRIGASLDAWKERIKAAK